MKAQVYGFYDEISKVIRWHITFSLKVDIAFWLDNDYRVQEGCGDNGNDIDVDTLHVIPAFFSIGQALALRDFLNGKGTEPKQKLLSLLKQCQKELYLDESIVEVTQIDKRNRVKPTEQKEQNENNHLLIKQWVSKVTQALEGRQLLWDELEKAIFTLFEKDPDFRSISQDELGNLVQLSFLRGDINITSGVSYPINIPNKPSNFLRKTFTILKRTKKISLICNRCQSIDQVAIQECKICNEPCATCENCIAMGRSKTCSPLIYFSTKENRNLLNLGGAVKLPFIKEDLRLSAHQQKISDQAVSFFNQSNQNELLIWAVTGAGKTEMIYPVVQEALAQRGKVLLASPRKDVIRELTPRFHQAFPQVKIASLFGGSTETWKKASLYLATTHQLVRFVEAFDLIIIDEMDAFPYHNDIQLQAYVQRALAKHGKIIYLSATPDSKWLEKVKRKQTDLAILPIRYHQNPLPVPELIIVPKKNKELSSPKIMKEIREFIDQVKKRNGQAFIFISNIRYIQKWLAQFKHWFPYESIEGVHAGDRLRDQKIDAFKRNQIQFLITTTIMERGVTIPNLHVLVLNADSKLFDSATLVQIAGRVGRSKDFPDGLVWFVASQKTEAMIRARKQIIKLNQLAGGIRNDQ